MFQYILFDLDGTLTDSKEGITKCVQYALKAFGIEEDDLDKLVPFIGPPLPHSFQKFYGLTEEQSYQATEKYRERFRDTGIYENFVYEGIPEVLEQLRAAGKKLAIASSKPEIFVRRIIAHYGMTDLFEAIVGSDLESKRASKSLVVEEALRQLDIQDADKSKCVLVGDRLHDVEGAHDNGIACLGVVYGFGGRAELQEAGAEIIADKVAELPALLV